MTSAELLAVIAANVDVQAAYDDHNDALVAELLNAPAASTRPAPAPLSVPIIFGLLDEPSLYRLSLHPSCNAIRQSLLDEDRLALGHWAYLLAARPSEESVGTITVSERDAISAYLASAVDVPASLAEAAFGARSVVLAADVAATRAVQVVASVTVSAPAELNARQEDQAEVVVLDTEGQVIENPKVLWQTSKAEILGVFDGGRLFAFGTHDTPDAPIASVDAEVIAIVDGVTGTATVTVRR